MYVYACIYVCMYVYMYVYMSALTFHNEKRDRVRERVIEIERKGREGREREGERKKKDKLFKRDKVHL